MTEDKFSEIKRQALHAAMGVILVILLSNHLINTWHIFWLLIIGSLLAFLSKRIRVPIISWILDHCERPEQRKTFPGRGPVFFILGSLLVLKLFPFDAALAAILILSLGDSVSHLFGHYYGRIPNPFNHKSLKLFEGTLMGAGAGFLGALFFVSPSEAFLASLGAMLAEAMEFDLNQQHIDDNLVIPLVAGTIILLLRTSL